MLKGTTCMRTSFIKSVSLLCIFSVTVAFLNRQIRESRLFINKFMLKNNFVEFLVFLPMILFCSVQFIQLSQQMGPYPISNEVQSTSPYNFPQEVFIRNTDLQIHLFPSNTLYIILYFCHFSSGLQLSLRFLLLLIREYFRERYHSYGLFSRLKLVTFFRNFFFFLYHVWR